MRLNKCDFQAILHISNVINLKRKKQISLRRCNPNDLELLATISRDTFVHAFEAYNDPVDFKTYLDEAFNTESIKTQLLNAYSHFYFIYLEDLLIGYFKLNVKTAQNERLHENSMELERIYIKASHQNQGLGLQVLIEIFKIAKAAAIKVLWLGVWQENKNAVRFYERHGFKKFGTHPYFIGKDKQTDWLMKYEFS
ncbi:MAG: GNAT family N-acetyltransferase [Flavobacteriaceae bacterium]|nr:GNAT family N-acetyltransferase [Flavobacteriaceae bacterium]